MTGEVTGTLSRSYDDTDRERERGAERAGRGAEEELL